MKGQVVAALSAIESIAQNGRPPVNVKFIIEGEEEIGSPSLRPFLEEHKSLLTSDFALNTDAGMIAADVPTIVYGLRGLAYFELRIYGPAHDLHSGLYGGVVHNPAQVLCELIAGMHDDQGRVTLPGYYERVVPLQQTNAANLTAYPWMRLTTNNKLVYRRFGEAGYTPTERVGARPTLEVNGLLSVSPVKVQRLFFPKRWLKSRCDLCQTRILMRLISNCAGTWKRTFPTVRWELTYFGGGPASITDPQVPGAIALARTRASVGYSPSI